jgi:hypothetical protein
LAVIGALGGIRTPDPQIRSLRLIDFIVSLKASDGISSLENRLVCSHIEVDSFSLILREQS